MPAPCAGRLKSWVGPGSLLSSWAWPATTSCAGWLDGTRRVPQEIFLKAVDIVVANDVREMSNINTPTLKKLD